MKNIRHIRHENLIALLAEANNNQSEVARRAFTTASHINSLIKKRIRSSGGEVGIGCDLARKLEEGFEKSEGWMDTDHTKLLDYPLLGSLSESEAEFANSMLDLYRENKPTPKSVQQLKKIFPILIQNSDCQSG